MSEIKISFPADFTTFWLPKQIFIAAAEYAEFAAFSGAAWAYPPHGEFPVYAPSIPEEIKSQVLYPALTAEDLLRVLPPQYSPPGHAGRFNLLIQYKNGQFSISYVATGSYLQLVGISNPSFVVALFSMYLELRSKYGFTYLKYPLK